MNRREFLFLRGGQAAELSCEQLYMRYLDSTVDGTTAQLFENIEQSLAAVTVLRLTDTAWLTCEELKPVESLLDGFRSRGGRVELGAN
jgi:hypothetical protein